MNNFSDLFSLKNKISIVTGALGLIGKHHCYALSEAGSNVVVADLSEEKSIEFARELPTESIGIELDVTCEKSIEKLVEITIRKFGKIDVLVNNAAINDMLKIL
jgi:NAD(P)-dependent dehydrogenase (short-subunit alcohol dehydrogenase family)